MHSIISICIFSFNGRHHSQKYIFVWKENYNIEYKVNRNDIGKQKKMCIANNTYSSLKYWELFMHKKTSCRCASDVLAKNIYIYQQQSHWKQESILYYKPIYIWIDSGTGDITKLITMRY